MAFDMVVAEGDIQEADRVEDLHFEIDIRAKEMARERRQRAGGEVKPGDETLIVAVASLDT